MTVSVSGRWPTLAIGQRVRVLASGRRTLRECVVVQIGEHGELGLAIPRGPRPTWYPWQLTLAKIRGVFA